MLGSVQVDHYVNEINKINSETVLLTKLTQIFSDPDVYVFGEILACGPVKDVFFF